MIYKRIKELVILFTIIASGIDVSGQNIDFIDGFSIRLNPGLLSFHGDLSSGSFNPFTVAKYDSKMGFSIAGIKEFNPKVAVQAQYLAGNTYSSSEEMNQYFNGSVMEFSVSAIFFPLGFLPNVGNRFDLKPYLSFGLGSFGYRSVRKFIDTDDIYLPSPGFDNDGITKTNRKNSLSMPMGIGLSVPINDNLAIDIDHTYRLTSTDLLDATADSKGVNDRFSHTSIGIRFTIQPPAITTPKPIITNIDTPAIKEKDSTPTKKNNARPLNVFVESIMDDVVTSGEVFAVNLRINKGDYTGPAKLIQRFPANFSALEASSTNGRFSFSNRNVLIEWDNMPADTMLTFTYYVRIGEDEIGSQTITGRFEYEEGNNWNTVRFNNYIFADKPANQILEEKNAEKPRIIETEIIEEKPENDTKVTALNIDPLILKDPKPEIEFRIQCGAFKDSNQGGLKLAERYGITEDMREVYENGWYKYTVGSFETYVEAVNFKNSFIKRTKLYTAFITAYKNGERVQNINDAFEK